MLRKLVTVMVVLVLCVGITLAEEFRAVITKVDGDKVTFAKTKFDKDTKKLEKGASETLPVADKVKVTKSKFDKDTKKAVTEDLDKGLKNEMFSKIDEKGISAQIVTDADNKKITEIRIGGGFGGFKKKDKQ